MRTRPIVTDRMNARHPCFTRQRSTCFAKARFLWQRAAFLAGFLLGAGAISFAGPKPPLLIAYFVPGDRTPIPGYVDRLDRVMTEVQGFYRKGMEAAGYGPMTFDLARDKGGKLEVHLVRGKDSMRAYGRDDSSKVRAEVASFLRSKGVGVDERTLVIFEVLLEWKDGRAIEVGPYVGGGSHLAGTAWVFDDELLDPSQLSSKAPGGYYGGPCSIGAFNSHYIGGVAHELGHALGLPHVAGPASNPKHSLMGDGNHTYGEELRGEGAGSYLHPASAMLLARCRPFAGENGSEELPVSCDFTDLQATYRNGQLVLAGRLEAEPRVFGLVAYNDSLKVPADYDAKGWTSDVDASGRFQLSVGELEAGPYELRLQACHTNGPASRFAFKYTVNPQGVPDLKPFSPSVFVLQRAVRAYARRDRRQVEALTAELERQSPGSRRPGCSPGPTLAKPCCNRMRHSLRPRCPQTRSGSAFQVFSLSNNLLVGAGRFVIRFSLRVLQRVSSRWTGSFTTAACSLMLLRTTYWIWGGNGGGLRAAVGCRTGTQDRWCSSFAATGGSCFGQRESPTTACIRWI